jgi:hypothetical protein
MPNTGRENISIGIKKTRPGRLNADNDRLNHEISSIPDFSP